MNLARFPGNSPSWQPSNGSLTTLREPRRCLRGGAAELPNSAVLKCAANPFQPIEIVAADFIELGFLDPLDERKIGSFGF